MVIRINRSLIQCLISIISCWRFAIDPPAMIEEVVASDAKVMLVSLVLFFGSIAGSYCKMP